jgi:hypothetical protein
MNMGAAIALSAAVLAQSGGVLVDRIEAVVDNEAITRTELIMEARVALVQRQGAAVATVDIPEELLASIRDYVIHERLIATEVRRTTGLAAPTTDSQVDAAVNRFASRIGTRTAYAAFLRRFGIGKEHVREILARTIRNQSYTCAILRTRLIGAARRKGSQPCDFIRPNRSPETEDTVSRERFEEAVNNWMKELRRSAEIRVLGPNGLESWLQ